jgi:hypothetical protein
VKANKIKKVIGTIIISKEKKLINKMLEKCNNKNRWIKMDLCNLYQVLITKAKKKWVKIRIIKKKFRVRIYLRVIKIIKCKIKTKNKKTLRAIIINHRLMNSLRLLNNLKIRNKRNLKRHVEQIFKLLGDKI